MSRAIVFVSTREDLAHWLVSLPLTCWTRVRAVLAIEHQVLSSFRRDCLVAISIVERDTDCESQNVADGVRQRV